MSISLSSALQSIVTNGSESKLPPTSQTSDGHNVIFDVSAKKNPPDARELADLVLKQIGYTPQDVEAYKKKHGEDPRTDLYKQINDCLNTPGCTENPPSKPGEKDAPTGLYPVKIAVSSLKTMSLRLSLDEIRQDTRTALAGKTAVEQVRIIESAKRRELNGKLDNPQQPINGQQPIAAAGTIAVAPSLPVPNKIELPKVDPKVIAQGAATLGEIALPLGAVLIEAVGPAAITHEFYKLEAEGAAHEYLAKARDAARTADFSPLEMTAEPNLPQGTPPLIFPPPPLPLPGTVDQTGKVKTITQTTSPIAPQIATAAPGKSNQPLPPPPPFVFPNGIDHFNHLTQLWMSTSRDQALKDLFTRNRSHCLWQWREKRF